MKIYLDKEMKQEVKENTLDLGIVKAGESQRYIFYILNDTKAELLGMEFFVGHKEVKIEEAPKKLDANKSGELILEWSPSIDLKEGLKTSIKISADELYSE